MKNTFLILLTSVVALTEVCAQKLETLQVGRYTRQGADGVLVESGILSVSTNKFEFLGASLNTEEALLSAGVTSSSLTAINGKFVTGKATIDTYRQFNGEDFISNYSFSTKAYPVVGGGLAYIVNFASGKDTSAPSASMKVSKSKLKEGGKSKILVKLNKATNSDIVVRYKISGKAKYNSDYRVTGTEGLVKIKKGKKSGSSTILVTDDKVKEKTEKMKITLQAGSEYKLGKKKKASVKILDNDK